MSLENWLFCKLFLFHKWSKKPFYPQGLNLIRFLRISNSNCLCTGHLAGTMFAHHFERTEHLSEPKLQLQPYGVPLTKVAMIRRTSKVEITPPHKETLDHPKPFIWRCIWRTVETLAPGMRWLPLDLNQCSSLRTPMKSLCFVLLFFYLKRDVLVKRHTILKNRVLSPLSASVHHFSDSVVMGPLLVIIGINWIVLKFIKLCHRSAVIYPLHLQ